MRSPLATALTNPTSLAILGLSFLAGLMAAWWLFPLGLLFWGISIAIIAGNKALRINYNMQAGTQTLSARFQGPYANVVRAQMRVFNLLSSSSGRTRRALEPVQQEIETLVNTIYTVCQRMTGPENFVKIAQNTDYDGQRALLVLSLGGTSDAVVRREKEEAIKGLETRMQEIKDISALIEQADAQVSSLAVSLDSLLAEIMSLQVRGAEQVEKEAPNLVQKIRQQAAQLQALETQVVRHQK
jgi:hypothetical protein